MSGENLNLTLKIWRQDSPTAVGKFAEYKVAVSPDASILEMLDELNDNLEREGKDPVVFESDCREGICGTCGLVINGQAHGKVRKIATCQLHMRHFEDGETIYIEPFRATAFPVIKDLMVERASMDTVLQAGGFVTINTGGIPDANEIPIGKDVASLAMDAAECIGCGACVASCKNSSAMLFVGAKVSQYSILPQGQPEKYDRVQYMVKKMDEMGFGSCTNTYACEVECPKGVSVTNIARMNRDFFMAKLKSANTEV